jgi:DNA-binding Xre family transcriptional regulator
LRVKEVAQEKGIGLAKLGRIADISYKTAQKVWHNPYHDVSLSMINRLAKALEVDEMELLESVPDDEVPPQNGEE